MLSVIVFTVDEMDGVQNDGYEYAGHCYLGNDNIITTEDDQRSSRDNVNSVPITQLVSDEWLDVI